MSRVRLLLAILLTFAAAPAPAARAEGERHPFSVHDMVRMERLGSPRPSPDGRWVVFTRRTYDWDADATSTNLWIVSIDGQQLRRLTTAKAHDLGPVWSPDGKSIAFISSRGGSSQIWSINPAGGEATQRSHFPVDVDNLKLSPDGTRFAFTAEVYPDCGDLDCTAQRDRKKADDPVSALVYTGALFRHWDSWEDGKRSHIFVWNPDGEGPPVNVMKGADADSPSKPFGGAEEFDWSPDGRKIAFTAKMVDNPAWSTDLDIYLAAADGSGYRCITEDNEAVDTQPLYSPDGTTIAYLAMERPGYEADRLRVVLHDRKSGTSRVLTGGWDRSAGSLAWAPEGDSLFVTADDTGRTKIFSVDAADGKATEIVGDHTNGSVAVAQGRRLVFVQDSLTHPAEIFTASFDGAGLRQITRVNAARLAAIEMSTPEEFWFKGAGGERVHGWLLKPAGFDKGRKYPVAYLIHGGPQGAYADQFHYRWNPQAYAGAGYVTVAVNFHGSTGYGQAFTDSIRRDWGGKPYQDLMLGLDHLIASYPYVDGDRVCALGASYGGYMVNWIAGQTDRFACLVNHDGEFDVRASYFATEEIWFPEWEFGGPPWEQAELFTRWSPAEHVAKWKTPMLVIHGGKDFRLPDTEGFATFNALQRLGVPSKLVYFPDENHWVLKARNSVFWHETVIGWLDEWTK